ncbi:hypothetical protein [Symbiopectobacterium purcellii]|uniref:hypothetical protein n=1 Tax=Symbiopectobacterium purcellii TaxID=2871826 RepID=UPI003F84F1C1
MTPIPLLGKALTASCHAFSNPLRYLPGASPYRPLPYPAVIIANRLKNDYILCPDMRQRSIAGCYQNNVAWLYSQPT